jgi:Lrp/AsnC family transcriptional regulator, leucine-responsive regulatory protein
MDSIDNRIVSELQRDSSRSIADLSAIVGLSQSACHRRMRALEENGVIAGYGALIDITLVDQSRKSMETFEAAVQRYDDILECDLVSGSADYRLRVAARDLQDFDTIHRRCLAELPGVSAMHTSFVIRPVKLWRGYSLRKAG